MDKVRIGVIGCGAISGAYLGMAKNFPLVELVACADMNPEAAKKKAAEFNVPKVCGVDELIADPSIEIVLNLTVPKAHAPVGKKILGIRIVQLNGSEAGFVHAVLLRAMVMGFINALVGVTSLIDPLCIFREDRRCLHDMIAGTIVIEA